MPRKKKLILGDVVQAYFLGSPEVCEVIEVIDNAYIGHDEVTKSTEYHSTSKNTTKNNELDAAIKKQKKFVKGKIDK